MKTCRLRHQERKNKKNSKKAFLLNEFAFFYRKEHVLCGFQHVNLGQRTKPQAQPVISANWEVGIRRIKASPNKKERDAPLQ
jgi:hypothetical protein